MSFGAILREIRRKRGSLRKVAEILDTDFAYLSRLENDKVPYRPSSEFLNRIVESLECNDEEKDSLFSEARRLDEETKRAVEEVHDRPELKTLFKSAPRLTEGDLKLLNKKIDEMLDKNQR